MADKQYWPMPRTRRFEVMESFRRYENVVYICGHITTVAEDADASYHPKGRYFTLHLHIEGTGTYREQATGSMFAYHELDTLVKRGFLREKAPVRKRRKKK